MSIAGNCVPQVVFQKIIFQRLDNIILLADRTCNFSIISSELLVEPVFKMNTG
jgi:hypothetical protein